MLYLCRQEDLVSGARTARVIPGEYFLGLYNLLAGGSGVDLSGWEWRSRIKERLPVPISWMVKGAIYSIPEQLLSAEAVVDTHLGDGRIYFVLYLDVNITGFQPAI